MQKAVKTDGNNKTRQTKLNNYKRWGLRLVTYT